MKATVTDESSSYYVPASRPISFFPLFFIAQKSIRLSDEKPTIAIPVVWSEKVDGADRKKLEATTAEDQVLVLRYELGDVLPSNIDVKTNETTDIYLISLNPAKARDATYAPFLNQKVVFHHRETGQQVSSLQHVSLSINCS